jgi:outer membrane protein OmpA-like peptidoglycan-associated protein
MLGARSLLSGRPVAELAFTDGRRLKVEQILLIRRGLGQLVGCWPSGESVSAHGQKVSGILTAINEVATEAFAADQSSLRRIDLGGALVYLRSSPTHLLAAKCSGASPASIERIIDEKFVAAIERLRPLTNSAEDAAIPDPAINDLLADLAVALQTGIDEQQAKVSRRRSTLSAAAMLFWSIGALVTAWAAWSAYWSYEKARVRGVAESVLRESRLAGYPVYIAVEQYGAVVALSGLVPSQTVSHATLERLRVALPASQVTDRTVSLPDGLEETRSELAALRADLARVRAERTKPDAALQSEVSRLRAALQRAESAALKARAEQPDISGLRAQIATLTAQLADSISGARIASERLSNELARLETARAADMAAVRSEIARAAPPGAVGARAQLEDWISRHAIFFADKTDYRDAKQAASALDELAKLLAQEPVKLRVIGHTDAKGGEVQNTPLSRARADKVAGELVARGIDAARLITVGRKDIRDLSPLIGESSPNRRVEFEIPFEGEGAP